VSINGKSASINSTTAYVDTGTSFVFAPPDDLAAVFKLIPGASSSESGGYVQYQIPCNTQTSITVTFSGVSYEISAQDWVAQQNSTTCISRIYGYEIAANTWLLGDTFIKNVYTVLDGDNMRIGFASKPPPPPKPTSTSTTASATTIVSAVTSLANGSSSQPIIPGFSGQETPAASAAQTTNSPQAVQTQVSPGDRLSSGSYVSVLCIAVVVAVLG
jgi:hypothetical protein